MNKFVFVVQMKLNIIKLEEKLFVDNAEVYYVIMN